MDKHWIEYDKRVRHYEAQGMTRSDAQGVVEAEDIQNKPISDQVSQYSKFLI